MLTVLQRRVITALCGNAKWAVKSGSSLSVMTGIWPHGCTQPSYVLLSHCIARLIYITSPLISKKLFIVPNQLEYYGD
jgi:hypothetical protein